MNKQEWLDRYQRRFIERAEVTPEFAAQCAAAENFEVLSDGYEDDPEDAADEEMSCWSE